MPAGPEGMPRQRTGTPERGAMTKEGTDMTDDTTTPSVSTEDDLLNSISANFGGESTSTMKKAKRDSLAEMTKQLPDWSLEPPETFLQ